MAWATGMVSLPFGSLMLTVRYASSRMMSLANGDNGNVELITVYDAPARAAFAPIPRDFDGQELLPKDVLTAPGAPIEPPGDAEGGPSYRITSLRLRASGRTIEAAVEPLPENVEAMLIIETKRDVFRVAMKSSRPRFVGRLSQEIFLGVEPIFATMAIASGPNIATTPPRWIDNERAIENAARDRDIDPNHEVFSDLCRKTQLPNVFQNPPKSGGRHTAHSSISIQEGQPARFCL